MAFRLCRSGSAGGWPISRTVWTSRFVQIAFPRSPLPRVAARFAKAPMNSLRRHSPDTSDAHLLRTEANVKEPAMTHLKTLFIAAPVALGLLAAPSAHAEWRGHGGGWGHPGWGYHGGGRGYGVPLVGALLGAAVVGGIIASQPAYAPPPAYYAPPPAYYAPPPAYYAPQPYYAAPGY
jgi:hypothetical protein